MMKLKVPQKIVDSGLVAVVRAESSEQAARIAEACAEGAVAAIEITFTVPCAVNVISNLAQRFTADEIPIGAETVLNPETARVATVSGTQFVVSPSLNPETARLCNRYQIPYTPGAGTLKEVIEAMECGAAIVNVFPGETPGPAFVKAVRSPRQAPRSCQLEALARKRWRIDPGGLCGSRCGGSLTAEAKMGDFQSISEMSPQFVARIRQARGISG